MVTVDGIGRELDEEILPLLTTLAIMLMYSFWSWVINTAVDITVIVFTAQSLRLQETQVCGGGRVFLCLVLPQYSWFQKSSVWAASSRGAACWALANGRISAGSGVNINTICSEETKASCQTLGPWEPQLAGHVLLFSQSDLLCSHC